MYYTVIVTGPPYGTQNATSALLFSKALITVGHTLKSVFFYFDGVLNANNMLSPADDEFNILEAWKNLYIYSKTKLNVCISASMRRGVIENNQASNMGISCGNLDSVFQLTGLVELGVSIQKSDRVMRF